MQTAEWERLNAGCARALDRFKKEAEATCRVLAAMRNFPPSLEDRSILAQQRSAENAAYSVYLELRQRLCRFGIVGFSLQA